MTITSLGRAGDHISAMAEASQRRSAAQRNNDSFVALPGAAYYLQRLIVGCTLGQSGGGEVAGLKVLDSPKELYPNGRLKYVVLFEDQSIGDIQVQMHTHVLKARTHIWLREDGSISSISTVDGQIIGGIKFPNDSTLWFDERNELSEARLSQEQDVKGNVFAGGTYLWFKDGVLTSARLAKEQKVDLVLLPKDTTVWLRSGGSRLESAKLRQDATVGGVRCLKETELKFSQGESVGKLVQATLAGDQEVQDVWCAGGTKAYFYNNGDLKSAVLSKRQEVERVEFEKGDKIVLGEGWRLGSATLAEPQEILGHKFKKGETVVFTYDKAGTIKALPPD